MTWFEAKLNRKDGGYTVSVGEAEIPLAKELADRLAAKQVGSMDVVSGIRPEHIQLKDEGTDVLHGKVDVSEMMGSEIHLHVTAAGRDVVLRVQTADLEKGRRGGFEFGSALNFTFRNDLIHLFDPTTEENLLPLE